MKLVHIVTHFFLWVGGLNWGLVGLFGFDLVEYLFGGMPVVQNWVYILVGLSTVYILVMHLGRCKICGGKGK